jgi:hypothetical protein
MLIEQIDKILEHGDQYAVPFLQAEGNELSSS